MIMGVLIIGGVFIILTIFNCVKHYPLLQPSFSSTFVDLEKY